MEKILIPEGKNILGKKTMELRIKIFGAKIFQKKNSRSLKFHQEKILKARKKFLQSKIIPGKILELREKIPTVKNFHEKFLQPKFSQKRFLEWKILSGKNFSVENPYKKKIPVAKKIHKN